VGTAAAPTRGFLLTLLGVLGIIQGVVTLIAGIAVLAENNDPQLISHEAASSGTLTATGVVLIVVGVITLLVAIGLLRGSNAARLIITVIEFFHVAVGVYVLIAHEGVQRWDGLVYILVALLILWILYRARSEEFFESRSLL
jgi:hypothetical protein